MIREEGQYIRMVDDDLNFGALKLFDYNGKCVKIYIRLDDMMQETDEDGLREWFRRLYDDRMEDEPSFPEKK